MVKTVRISDKAFALMNAHASANGETQVEAMDELFAVADKAWCMDMPEMKKVWTRFHTPHKEIGQVGL